MRRACSSSCFPGARPSSAARAGLEEDGRGGGDRVLRATCGIAPPCGRTPSRRRPGPSASSGGCGWAWWARSSVGRGQVGVCARNPALGSCGMAAGPGRAGARASGAGGQRSGPTPGGWASTCSVLHGAELRPGLVPAGTPQAGRAPWVAVQLSRAQRCWGEGLGGGTWGAGHWRWELVETPLGPRSQIESCNKGVGERFLARRPFF